MASITIDIDGSSARRQRELEEAQRRDLQHQSSGVLEVEISYTVGDGKQVTQKATVTLRESETVYAVHFENIPSFETVTVSALGPYGESDVTHFVSGTENEIAMVLQGIGEVASVENYDFFEGSIEGWDLRGPKDSFEVVPHLEDVTPDNLFKRGSYVEGEDEFRLLQDANETGVDDYDLVITTNKYDPSEVSASYTFEATDSVMIRYRFVAPLLLEEGPITTEENDYYHLSIRSSSGTGAPHFSETKSILGLGTSAFDPVTASTEWMVAMVSNVTGVTEVRGTVGKVGKSLYQSQLVIDYVDDV